MRKELLTWRGLNEALMVCDEAEANRLLKAAIKAGAATRLLLRIHSRINRLRAKRERSELGKLKRTKTRRH